MAAPPPKANPVAGAGFGGADTRGRYYTDPMPPAPPTPSRPARLFTAAGVAVAVAALAFGVPLFLQSGPWCDLTLYQLAARNLLGGGVLYRDIFDTNLPGFVWVFAAIQAAFGEGVVAARAIDLAVVAAVTALLTRQVGDAGGGPAARAWFVAGVALFYPLTPEFDHAQRDVWMLLPALAAFRLRQAGRAPFVEGLLWGVAVWVKPHVVVPAFAVWAASARYRPPGRPLGTVPLLAAGSLLGLAGLAAIAAGGAWPAFVEVLTVWNPEYTAGTMAELGKRLPTTFQYFAPWSLMHFVTLPMAVAQLARGRRPDPAARPRALLAAMYLAWMLQALVVQRGLEYVHVPETLLALAVAASYGVPVGLTGGLTLAVQAAAVAAGVGEVTRRTDYFPMDVPRVFSRAAWSAWPHCFGPGSPALRDRLGQYTLPCCPTWTDLAAVEGYLRAVEPPLADGELLTFHDSPHPLYLSLRLKPATRYLHFGTVTAMRSQQPRVAAEVRRAAPRYVVSDLRRMTWDKGVEDAPDARGDPDGLPAWLPLSQRGVFPWDQPVAFRAGRYVVHRVTRPIGDVDVPDWRKLDELGPGDESSR